MAYSTTIATVSEILEYLEISDFYDAETIADQYESWEKRVISLIGCDDIEDDLYLIMDRSGCPVFNYILTRTGAGMGFWESYRWDKSEILNREAIADGMMI